MSGLPRFSKLPQLPHSRQTGSIDEGSSGAPPAAPASGIPGASKRSSIAIPQRPGSAMKSHADAPAPAQRSNRQSMLMKPGFQTSAAREVQEMGTSKVTSPTSPESPTSNLSEGSTVVAEDSTFVKPTANTRKPRPSLSDRTMESLYKVPPSPSPARRGQSGFFLPDSPMKPPSRAGSSLGFSRPESRTGSSIPGVRPPSPNKGIVRSSTGIATPAKRSVSSSSINTGLAGNRRSVQLPSSTRILPPSPSTTGTSRIGGIPSRTANGSKTMSARPAAPKSPTKDLFGGPLPEKPSSHSPDKPISPTKPLRPAQGKSLIGSGPPRPLGLRKPQPKTPKEEVPTSPTEERKVQNSSQSLRETIAAAKAASRSVKGSKADAFVPRAVANTTMSSLGPDTDPSSLDLQDSAHVNIVKKRINIARKDGKLNIAALCLTQMPTEVLKMYEYDPNNAGGAPWYENVDLTRLLAADNELKDLPSELFPSNETQDEEHLLDGIFAGLTDIDLHGNMLLDLPASMGNLTVLTALNLSRNQLTNKNLETISRIKSLKELRISENKLSGTLPDCIGQLEELVTLDVQKNAITELPASIGRLSKLSKLIVAENRLTSIPFEAIFDIRVTEIVAFRNQLNGYLFSSNVPSMQTLKVLDVSTNALSGITEGSVLLPELKKLEIANNKISELPNVSSWINLTSINAEENKLSAFPEGFADLQHLRSADFGNNSLLTIDEAIGSMDSLMSLNIKNNPIRERRLPRLTTEELKAELRSRVADVASPTLNGTSTVASPTSGWPVKNGTLDRSSTRLQSLDQSDLEPLVGEQVSSLVLHHNQLPKISPAIELLGATLTSLDVSHNKLGKSDMYFTETLTLPSLQTLNLTSNALISLDPLVNRLSAPKLATLIFSFNRIKTLPKLCDAFPNLTKLIGANNAIGVLDVDSVRGLQVLDVSSNELEALPAKLALLQGQLRTLMVTGNKFRAPGYNILQKGTEEVLKWLRMKIPAGEEGAIGAAE